MMNDIDAMISSLSRMRCKDPNPSRNPWWMGYVFGLKTSTSYKGTLDRMLRHNIPTHIFSAFSSGFIAGAARMYQ